MHCLASCKSLLHILIVRLLTFRMQQLDQVQMGKLPEIIETSRMEENHAFARLLKHPKVMHP